MSAGKQQVNQGYASDGDRQRALSDRRSSQLAEASLTESRLIDQLCRKFEQEWGSANAPSIPQILDAHPLVNRSFLLRDLLSVEIELRWQSGTPPTISEYRQAFPEQAKLVEFCFQQVGDDLQATRAQVFETDRPIITDTDCGLGLTSEFRASPPSWRPQIAGYEVGEEIGRGGMGVVFKARHLRLDRAVALKVMIGRELIGGSQRERFCREGEIVASLVHPNVAQVYDAGEMDGIPWLAMELVEGGTLADLPGPLPADVATDVLARIADALGAAHANGIIHRDVKPANILLDEHEDGIRIGDRTVIPKITDFGLARRLDSEVTLSGAMLGTPGYMAPEQLTAAPDEIGAAADVHAVGVVLYELITGVHPYHSEHVITTFDRIRHHKPQTPSTLNRQVPSAIERVCLICLSKNPTHRFANGDELAAALRNPESVHREQKSLRWKNRSVLTMAGVLLAAASITYSVINTWTGGDETTDVSPFLNHAVPPTEQTSQKAPTLAIEETLPSVLRTILKDRVGSLIVSQGSRKTKITKLSELPSENFEVTGLILTTGAFSNGHFHKQLAEMTSLEIFDATYTEVNDDDLAVLQALPQLKDLDLYGTKVTNKCVESIAKMKALESLSIGLTEVTIPALVKLTHLPQLQFLNLEGAAFSQMDAANTLNQLPHLRTLQVVSCNDRQLNQVAQVRRIRELRLFASQLQSSPCETLSQMADLEFLWLTVDSFNNFTFDFTDFESLQTLQLNFDQPSRNLPHISPGRLKFVSVVDPYSDEPQKNYPAWARQMPSIHVEVNGLVIDSE